MNQGTYPLAASMVNQINRLDQISNNLANVNTNGFKQEGTTETTFNYHLEKMKRKGEEATKINEVTNNIPKIDTKFIIGEMGPIQSTGNNLDFALTKPNLFFKIEDKNSDTVYTRDGAFKILEGFLVDSNGNKVLNADNEPIVVEDGFESQIGVIEIPFSNLDKIGNNNFKIKDENNLAIFGNNDGLVLQGSIERSNVNSITAMVELIDAQRRFEQSQKAISTIDELNSKMIDKIGNNTR